MTNNTLRIATAASAGYRAIKGQFAEWRGDAASLMTQQYKPDDYGCQAPSQ